MEKHVYLMNTCLLWTWKVALHQEWPFPQFSFTATDGKHHHTRPRFDKYHTKTLKVQTLIDGGKISTGSHYREEIIQRGWGGGRYWKTLFLETNTPHYFFTMDYMYILNWLEAKTKKHKRSLEKAYTSERWSALDNSQKLMSAYVFIQNRFSNNIWVVQFFFLFFLFLFKIQAGWLLSQPVCVWNRLTPILFTVLHNPTKASTLEEKETKRTVHLSCLHLLWSPCSQTSNRLLFVQSGWTDYGFLNILKSWPAEIKVSPLYVNSLYRKEMKENKK